MKESVKNRANKAEQTEVNDIVNILGAKNLLPYNLASIIANNINTKLLGVSGPDMRHYNIMLNYLYQTSKHFINPERKDILTKKYNFSELKEVLHKCLEEIQNSC